MTRILAQCKSWPEIKDNMAAKRSLYCALHKHANSKFKSQLTIAFFAAVNLLNGPLRRQDFTLTSSKGQGL